MSWVINLMTIVHRFVEPFFKIRAHMMTSSNGNLFRVTGHLNSPVPPHKGQWRGAFDPFFVLRLNKRLSKHLRRQWFETPSRPLWLHCNEYSANPSTWTYHPRMNNLFKTHLESSPSVYPCIHVYTCTRCQRIDMGPTMGRPNHRTNHKISKMTYH